jgi:tetratricopeptide (TPR) repeat protein
MKKHLNGIATFVGIFLFVVSGASAQKSNLAFDAAYGPNPVGFRVVLQYDYSRSYKLVDAEGKQVSGQRARPIQTLIWYPAKKIDETSRPMLYGSYLDLFALEENYSLNEHQRTAKVQSVLRADNNLKNYEREKVQVTKAFRDAPAQPGSFPVVVYAPSFSASAFENSDLCEYLASHGYIVVASPDMGPRSRGTPQSLEGIETQVDDIEFLIGYAHTIPEAEPLHLAVMGYSWGGMSNVFAAEKDNRISAIVSLDGGFRYQPDLMKTAEDVKLINPNRLTTPFLYFSSKPYTMEELSRFRMSTPYNFLNELRYDDFYFVQSPTMIHPDFCSYFIRFREDQYFTDSTAAEVSQDYSWMARYALQFLQAYLKSDPASLQFLKNDPEKNSVPRHRLTVETRQALRPAASIPDFALLLASEGFDKATEIYERARKSDPAFKLDENEVNRWGYELLPSDATKAVAIFKLNVAMYPDSANAYDSLAEAQEAAGDKEHAIANYHKSLQLKGDNGHATSRLMELEAPKPHSQ